MITSNCIFTFACAVALAVTIELPIIQIQKEFSMIFMTNEEHLKSKFCYESLSSASSLKGSETDNESEK